MIPLLFLVLFAEGAMAFLLMVEIGPLRELAMRALDQLKTGKGPATMKTLACTMAVIFLSSLTSIIKIQNRGAKLGTVTPMDQVLWRTHLLETSLTGYALFLGLVIDRLHHCLGKLVDLRSSEREMEKLRKELGALKVNDSGEAASLGEILKKMKAQSDGLEKRASAAEAHVASLQKQLEELLLEYDRLLEDNQNLQRQTLAFKN
ncbi:uncharacterized protein LOC144705652 [Wolffia australiana]